MESYDSNRSAEHIISEATRLMPVLTRYFESTNAVAQKEAFLAGGIDRPYHERPMLESLDSGIQFSEFEKLHGDVRTALDIPTHYKPIYEDQIIRSAQRVELLAVAQSFHGGDPTDSQRNAYMDINEQLYGKLDIPTYEAMLLDRVSGITVKPEDTIAASLYQELLERMPDISQNVAFGLYEPSDELFSTVRHMALVLYEPLLKTIPDDDRMYDAAAVNSVLEHIVKNVFADSAQEWRVVLSAQKTLEVVPKNKEIRNPIERTPMTAQKLRGLVVHELGVHMMRSVRGGETDLSLMSIGYADYFDSEEGLGKVMEQVISGKFVRAGTEPYISAGLLATGHSFREAYDIKWRIGVLNKYKPGTDISAEAIAAAQNTAYTSIARSTRGTDTMPWLKDLAYYNGSTAMWKYFEANQDDEFMLNLALLGKFNSNDSDHVRAALETRTP